MAEEKEKDTKGRPINWAGFLIIGLAVLLGLAGCGGEEKEKKSPPSTAEQVPEKRKEEPKEKPEGEIIAEWETLLLKKTKQKNALVYRDGKTFHMTRVHGGKKWFSNEWFERPSESPDERKFDEGPPDCQLCGYFTISRSGIIKSFMWHGGLIDTLLATSMPPGAMNIGRNPQKRPCVPKQLSPASVEFLRLYEQLQGFKDDPEFVRLGFSPNGPYFPWMEAVEKLRDKDNSFLDLTQDLNLNTGALFNLGTVYVSLNLGSGDIENAERWERQIQAGRDLAECRVD